jgi:hypothetical protein
MSIVPDAAVLAAAHLIKLIENREIAPYTWVNADDDHKATLSESGVLKHCLSTCLSTA